jgi:hypothetical protein
MIAEKIDSVSRTLRELGGQVHPEVYELLRVACAELTDASESARRLEGAVLIITTQVNHLAIQ